MPKKRLYLIDAYALIYRSYYAFMRNPMFNAEGFNTSTVFGFINALEDILNKENVDHFAIAFDPPGGTFRNEIFPAYKANRDATPEEIKKSVPVIKEILKAYKFPVVEVSGYEADDVIGTIAKRSSQEGFEVYMVTPDKDYIQLLDENIFILRPGKSGSGFETIHLNNIHDYFEVESPGLFLDLLGLMGDKADNVPGAPGVGEKTAAKLLREFGSIESIFENVSKLKGKLQETIAQNIDNILLSRRLCTICIDVPLEFQPDDYLLQSPDIQQVRSIFKKMNFSGLEKRFLTRVQPPVNTQPTLFDLVPVSENHSVNLFSNIHNTDHHYQIIQKPEDLQSLVYQLLNEKELCIDTETTSLNIFEARLVGISISIREGKAYYIPVPRETQEAALFIDILRPILENDSQVKIGQNIKYDILIFKNHGVEVQGEIFDTMLAHYLLQPEQRHNMNYLSEKYLKYTPVAIEELIGSGKQPLSMDQVPLEKIADYAAEDADVTLKLKNVLSKELNNNNLIDLSKSIEMPLVPVLASMEYAGIKLDIKALEDIAVSLKKDILQLEEEIYEHAGLQFNIQSPKQLGDILFVKLGLLPGKKNTKSKQFSTSEEVLTDMSDAHPIIPLILDYRTLRKLLSTYVEALPALVNPKTGRLHTSFNQALAATGRLSSVNPNLQNIPIRTERGREVRKAFIAGDDHHIIMSADYSQIELRIMAHMSQDPNMIEAFRNNEDIHTATASKIYNIAQDDISRDMRNRAKTANFGIIYGISAFGLSQRLKIPRKEASLLIEGYFNNFPGVKKYMDESVEFVRKHGYACTLAGRKRHLPDIHSANATVRNMAERNAINSPIQGTAADIIKLAMVNIAGKMKERKMQSRMILQVHDELVFDALDLEVDELSELVKYEMENAVLLSVPLTVEVGTGKNWLEAH